MNPAQTQLQTLYFEVFMKDSGFQKLDFSVWQTSEFKTHVFHFYSQ